MYNDRKALSLAHRLCIFLLFNARTIAMRIAHITQNYVGATHRPIPIPKRLEMNILLLLLLRIVEKYQKLRRDFWCCIGLTAVLFIPFMQIMPTFRTIKYIRKYIRNYSETQNDLIILQVYGFSSEGINFINMAKRYIEYRHDLRMCRENGI